MKTKEFIKRVEELGFEVFNEDGYLVVKDEYGYNLAYVNKTTLTQMSTDYMEWDGVYDEDKTKLFDLIVEYAKTPVNEREEEKKFYLKHRWFKPSPIYKNYLNYWIGNDEYWLDYKNESKEIQTQFTLKEIDEIKEKFNTDLGDFKKTEVKE